MKTGKYRQYPIPVQDLIATQGKKYCGRCNTVKNATEFAKRKNTSCGLSSWCVTCNRQYDKDNLTRFRRKRIDRYYKNAYGISYRDFLAVVYKQQGLCAICEVFMDEPHLDHCHMTGKIRSALCHKCNVGIGHFLEDPALLLKAAQYLGGFNG
jgi:hypothetical protein